MYLIKAGDLEINNSIPLTKKGNHRVWRRQNKRQINY
jgi:hypothetical protein